MRECYKNSHLKKKFATKKQNKKRTARLILNIYNTQEKRDRDTGKCVI